MDIGCGTQQSTQGLQIRHDIQVSPPRAAANLLLVLVLWCLCCAPLTCKKSKDKESGDCFGKLNQMFLEFSEKEGNPNTMNFNELKEILTTDGSNSLQNIDLEDIKNLMAEADSDKDGELSYMEYFSFKFKYNQRLIKKYEKTF
ncbi:uncharacterized protein RB166_021010 [Leptodactylus fuscus]